MSLATFAQALVAGAVNGCFYALLAVPFALILGISRALNLAHGEFVVLGAYVGYGLWALTGLNPLLFLPAAAIALLPLGLLWARLLTRLREPVERQSLVLTFGLSLFLQSVMLGLFKADYRLLVAPAFEQSLLLGPIHLNRGRVLLATVSLAAVLGLHLALTRTRSGRAILATSLNREAAALMGINVDRMIRITFLMASGLAGAAGLLFATMQYVHPQAGMELTLLAIILVLLGGVGRLSGLLLGAFSLALTEALTVAWAAPRWRELLVALFLLGALLARPRGLISGRSH